MKKIVTVIGARPQFIKAAPMSRELAKSGLKEIVVHTGQHYDTKLSGIFFEELGLPEPHYQLEVGSLSHGAQTGRMLEGIEKVLLEEKPDLVLVYGDTNSTLSGALAASKLQIPVAHVEAGLRSFNTKMPEETNRVLTDHCSTLLFAPTEDAVKNLIHEGIPKDRIIRTGDIMYDASKLFVPIAVEKSNFLVDNRLQAKKYILATLHRAENTDSKVILQNIIEALGENSKTVTVLFPLHPRTQAALDRFGINYRSSGITFTEPLGYLDMIQAQRNASLIVTDSGGVQKEAYFYQIPCLTLRNETEWVELVGAKVNRLVDVSTAEGIKTALNEIFDIEWSNIPLLYGDGDAASEIVRKIISTIKG